MIKNKRNIDPRKKKTLSKGRGAITHAVPKNTAVLPKMAPPKNPIGLAPQPALSTSRIDLLSVSGKNDKGQPINFNFTILSSGILKKRHNPAYHYFKID